MKQYIASVMYGVNDDDGAQWTMHYAWTYDAESLEQARDCAKMHFDAAQNGVLLSIYVTDGMNALFERKSTDARQITVAPIDSTVPHLGPDTRKIADENTE